MLCAVNFGISSISFLITMEIDGIRSLFICASWHTKYIHMWIFWYIICIHMWIWWYKLKNVFFFFNLFPNSFLKKIGPCWCRLVFGIIILRKFQWVTSGMGKAASASIAGCEGVKRQGYLRFLAKIDQLCKGDCEGIIVSNKKIWSALTI